MVGMLPVHHGVYILPTHPGYTTVLPLLAVHYMLPLAAVHRCVTEPWAQDGGNPWVRGEERVKGVKVLNIMEESALSYSALPDRNIQRSDRDRYNPR